MKKILDNIKFEASNIAPNPNVVKYWADLSEDATGGVIKTYHGIDKGWLPISGGSAPSFTNNYKIYDSVEAMEAGKGSSKPGQMASVKGELKDIVYTQIVYGKTYNNPRVYFNKEFVQSYRLQVSGRFGLYVQGLNQWLNLRLDENMRAIQRIELMDRLSYDTVAKFYEQTDPYNQRPGTWYADYVDFVGDVQFELDEYSNPPSLYTYAVASTFAFGTEIYDYANYIFDGKSWIPMSDIYVAYDEDGNIILDANHKLLGKTTAGSQYNMIEMGEYTTEVSTPLSQIKVGDNLRGKKIVIKNTDRALDIDALTALLKDQNANTISLTSGTLEVNAGTISGTGFFVSFGDAAGFGFAISGSFENTQAFITFDENSGEYVFGDVSEYTIPDYVDCIVTANTFESNPNTDTSIWSFDDFYFVENVTLDQVEVGSEHIHLNLNSSDKITVDTPNGKEQIAYMSDLTDIITRLEALEG